MRLVGGRKYTGECDGFLSVLKLRCTVVNRPPTAAVSHSGGF